MPLLFLVMEGAVSHLSAYLEQKNLQFRKILVISGVTFSFEIAMSVAKELHSFLWKHVTIESNSLIEVERLSDLIYQNSVDLIIGIGGGKVIDITKRLSLIQRINSVVVPTVISNDGLISPICVLQTTQGITQSMAGQMPLGVIVDLDIVSAAPKRFLQAAAGDILSNLSATNDWQLAQKKRNEQINDIANQMSTISAYSSVNFNKVSLYEFDFLKQIIYSQFNSGLAMAVAGTSRPCSGSEHLVSHAVDFLKLSNQTLHGLQVGSISLFSLYLQGKLDSSYISYARKLDIPLIFTDLSPDIASNLSRIFETARIMRPDRYTVLDCFQDVELLNKFEEYLAFMQRQEKLCDIDA